MLIPIGHEDQQVTRLPWVTILLVAANVVVFLLTSQSAQQHAAVTRERAQQIVRYATEHPYLRMPPEIRPLVTPAPPQTDLSAEIVAEQQSRLDAMLDELKSATKDSTLRRFGYTPAEPSALTLFTSMFLHGGWLHLLGNMLFLWLAGSSLEDRWGRVVYTIVYLASGGVAGLLHAAMNPGSSVPMVGASGAIAGLMGAFLIRLAATRIRFFYWLVFFRGTFVMPAYVALPLWLLQQFAMARSGAAGRIAVWAHIGGFLFGTLVAIIIRLTDVEKNILAPAIAKKTAWSPSEHLTAALEKLDRGDADAGIQDLVAFLKRSPNNIEARAALVAAYTQKGDLASAGRESARLVSAYVVARDLDGGMASLAEHRRSHPEVPVALRSLLALAAHREKEERHREAADLYREAVKAWPDDPLLPKARIAYGRLMLEVFQQPDDTLAILEGAVANPQTTPEFRRAAEELITAARRARRDGGEPQETAPATGEFEPTSLTARAPEASRQEPAHSATWEAPSVGMEPSAPALDGEPAPAATPELSSPEPAFSAMGAMASLDMEAPARTSQMEMVPPASPPAAAEPTVALQTMEGPAPEPASDELPEPAPTWTLMPVSMRAVDVDARGLRLQNREGKTGRLPWPSIVGVSVARIADLSAAGEPTERLILDLLIAPQSAAGEGVVRCVRLAGDALAIPQLQAEASPVRGFQRLVATILKATGATAYPSRDDCLGLQGFPTFSDLGAYETALVACLRLAAA